MSLELHPEFLSKNGKTEFVVLPYEEFELIKSTLEDVEDLKILREAKNTEKHEVSKSLEEVEKELGL